LSLKIGIPNALFNFNYLSFWEAFFARLGLEVINSGETTKSILDAGVKCCVDEACLPIKVYHGHVCTLKEKADLIFLPRMLSTFPREYNCPMICGVSEMVINAVPKLPPVINCTINCNSNQSFKDALAFALSSYLKCSKQEIVAAYLQTEQSYCHNAANSWQQLTGRNESVSNGLKIAVLGQPYNISDSYINNNLIAKLQKRGANVVLASMVDRMTIDRKTKALPKRIFWSFGREIVGAGLSFLEDATIDGIIYLSAFGCGIDALLEEYLSLINKKSVQKPYTVLTIDEHSGDAGFNTRLEAFLDMVEWRKRNAHYISAHG